MSSKFRSEHLAAQTLNFEGPNCFTRSIVPLDLNRAMDPMAGTIPAPLGEHPKGFWGLGKASWLLHMFLLWLVQQNRGFPVLPKIWTTRPLSHIKDVFTVYMVNALGLGGSTGFGWKKPGKRSAKMPNSRKSSGRCKAGSSCPGFTCLHWGIQTEF